MNPTLTALTGFVTWTLLLLVLMEGIRTKLVATKAVPANGFVPDNANLSPFMQRLARAHANCVEGLPVFGGLMVISVVAGRAPVTDSPIINSSWSPRRRSVLIWCKVGYLRAEHWRL